MGKVRQPVHQKSIATKEKIIKHGFQLMCEKGYHNVNTIDIANESHVSTGIIYQYFHDKHDILIEGVKRYSDEIMFPMLEVLKNEVDLKNMWLIKGRGAAMFKEKLNIIASPITYILVDETKFVNYLGEKCKVPIEVFPSALKYVSNELEKLGAKDITYRGFTENNNGILDVKFEKIYKDLEKDIKAITGVIESGLFLEYKNIEIVR